MNCVTTRICTYVEIRYRITFTDGEILLVDINFYAICNAVRFETVHRTIAISIRATCSDRSIESHSSYLGKLTGDEDISFTFPTPCRASRTEDTFGIVIRSF